MQETDCAAKLARRLVAIGLNALPSNPSLRRPELPESLFGRNRWAWSRYQERLIEPDIVAAWSAPNIQIVLGDPWGLAVVDCDGEDAEALWLRMLEDGDNEHAPTWKVRTGGGGLHTYFRTGDYSPPKETILWKGADKHSQIEILGTGALAIAPPSTHYRTNKPYAWVDRCSPDDIAIPSLMPTWLTERCQLIGEQKKLRRPAPSATSTKDSDGYVALAVSWGLKLAGGASAKGWIPCYRAGRDEGRPSAAISTRSGNYSECGSAAVLSIWDLGVLLGVGPTWQSVKDTYHNRIQ